MNEQTNVCNYADDTTFYVCEQDLESLLQRLDHDSLLAIEWFENNYMKLNGDKCHLLISGFSIKIIGLLWSVRQKYGKVSMKNY